MGYGALDPVRHAYQEVGAVNWPEGNKLVLRLQMTSQIEREARRAISNLD